MRIYKRLKDGGILGRKYLFLFTYIELHRRNFLFCVVGVAVLKDEKIFIRDDG